LIKLTKSEFKSFPQIEMDLEERNKIFIIDEILAKNKANIEND
jgi:hypothetical protein